MHLDDREFGGVSSLDHDSALCEQQTVLLNRIDVLTRDATIDNPSEKKYIYAIKEEYNELVKKRAKLARSPLSDPMEVLPSDLWPDIIRNIVTGVQYPVNELLDLTSVSNGWCSVLTTLPVIWTHIRLDQREPDYLAKAMMCIQLSGECEIDLSIRHLTADEWRGISSMIVPEGRRIRRLSFMVYDTDHMGIRQVLGDFTKFPVLQELFLPNMPSQLSDQQYIRTLLTEKMPSIKTIDRLEYTTHDEIWNPCLTYLKAESLTKEAIETLMPLPYLHHLVLKETAQTLENIPSLLKSSFGAVQTFLYEGADICRRLTWIGNNLSTLSTHYPKNGDANALLLALSRFPCLHELTIEISSSLCQPIQNSSRTTSPHNSIRVLKFSDFVQDLSGADWDVLFSIFFAASPCLEDLSIEQVRITDVAWNSIQSITNLRDLNIDDCSIDDPSSIPLNMESLRQCKLALGSHSLAQLLARLESKSLQTLQLTGIKIYPPTITSTPSVVAGAAFPNITTLVLETETPVTWELGALSELRALELRFYGYSFKSHMTYWVSDVLEAILMRPRDNPALEKITLACIFIEWDILLLMLERRNFLNEPGISSIKTLVFNHNLPYRLLYPLSELLGGRFVERDTNRSFSLDAIGERMWNESLSGCMPCHHSFRKCESLPEREIHPEVAAGVHKEYPLPNEYLAADPRLPLEMKLWLSGRRERQISFMRRYEETGRQLRPRSLCNAERQYRKSVITGDVLAGAHFGHNLQEQNEVTERVYVDST